MKNNHPRNLGFILIGIGLVLIATGINGLTRPDEFRSQTRIALPRLDSPGFDDGSDQYSGYIASETSVIKSETILSNVVTRLELASAWGNKHYNGRKLRTSETIALLRSHVDVRPVSNTRLLNICATSEDPTEAALIANTVAEAYRDWWNDRSRRMVEAGISELEKQLTLQAEKITQASNKVIRLMKELEIPEAEILKAGPQIVFGPRPDDESNVSSFEATVKYKGRLETLEKLQKLDRNELAEVLPALISDSTLSELTLEAKQCREAIQNTATNDAVRLERLQTEMAVLEKRLDTHISGVMEFLKQQLSESKTKAEQANATAQARKEETQRQLSARRPFYDARREFEEMGDFRRLLVRKINLEKADLAAPTLAGAEIVERAIPPITPVKRTRPLGVLLVITGLACSAWGVKFVWRSWDKNDDL